MKKSRRAHVKRITCLVLALALAVASFPVFASDSCTEIPITYYFAAKHAGTIEKITYKITDDGKSVTKNALVYLPYGYNKNDSSTKYDILYLVHGSCGDENTYFDSSFKNIVDNMIANGKIKPFIIVTPTIDPGSDDYESEFDEFPDELTEDLMPAVENTYHTYAKNTTSAGFEASRSHRAFGGFSMGGMVTWDIFIEHLGYFEYFLPMSGDYESVYEDDLEGADESADILGKAAQTAGYTANDFYIFAASGSEDFLSERLGDQITSMKKKYPSLFTDSNTIFYEASGSQHDFHYSFGYLYNGLPYFFK